MKLLILGASGPTGIQLVRLAIQAGHETTAVVRDRSKITSNDLGNFPRLLVKYSSDNEKKRMPA